MCFKFQHLSYLLSLVFVCFTHYNISFHGLNIRIEWSYTLDLGVLQFRLKSPLFFSFIQFVVIKKSSSQKRSCFTTMFLFLSLCAFDWHHQGKSRFSKCGGVDTTDRNTKFSQVQYYHTTCLDFYWLQKNHVKSYRCSHNFMRGNKDKTLDNSSYQLQANKPPSYISRMIWKSGCSSNCSNQLDSS